VQGERDVQDDEPARLALEPAVAVGEPALLRRQRALGLLPAVVHAHRGDRLSDLLAVGPDVLDGRRAGGARDAGERLDPGQLVVHGVGDDVVPRLAGLHGERRAVALDPAASHRDDVTRPAGIRGDHVGAAAEHQQRRTALVGCAHRGDEPGGIGDHDDPVGDPADPESREARQLPFAKNLHGATLAGTTLRTGERAGE
jgi:hypothetical protein